MKTYLYIFRRDLRLQDNTAINLLLDNNKDISFAFIYDKRQLNRNDFVFRKSNESQHVTK